MFNRLLNRFSSTQRCLMFNRFNSTQSRTLDVISLQSRR